MSDRRMCIGTVAGWAALATGGGLGAAAQAASVQAVIAVGAPGAIQSEPLPRVSCAAMPAPQPASGRATGS